jgi:hypothetical protein
MASPVVANHAISTFGAFASGIADPISPTLPGGVSAGDLLVALIAGTSLGSQVTNIEVNVADSPGWYVVGSTPATSSNYFLYVLAKIATGSDALKIHSPAQLWGCAVVYDITGHGSTVSMATANSSSNTTNAPPPSLTISGAAQDMLFLTMAVMSSTVVATVAPSGYSNLYTSSLTNVAISTSEKAASAVTGDTPGTFTSASSGWRTATIGVYSTAVTTKARMTQEAIETATAGTPAARMTQEAIETVTNVNPKARATQVAIEVLSSAANASAQRPVVQACG